MSTTLTVQRRFAAVHLTDGDATHIYNRDRLARAIALLDGHVRGAGTSLAEEYPAMPPFEVHRYLCAAQRLIDHGMAGQVTDNA